MGKFQVAASRDEPASAVPTAYSGLTTTEAAQLLAEFGPNRAVDHKEDGFFEELLESLREPLVLLLLGVGVLYLIVGSLSDALVVFGVILLVSLIEAGIEFRAGRAISALAAMAEPQALVWRDHVLSALPVEMIVPGDLIELRAGNRIPADAEMVEGDDLRVDESVVTGESEPLERIGGDELLAGTLLVAGRGRARVTRTGAQSTLGRIAALMAETKEPRTPLQKSMDELARTLLWVALGVSVVIPIIGLLAGQPPLEMLLSGLSLAFATIPEELPILIVVVLALGSLRLAKRGAIVRRLIAAETLGAVTVICTDKTGTLTRNRLELVKAIPFQVLAGVEPAAEASTALLLRAAALATDHVQGGALLEPVDAAVQQTTRDAVTFRDHASFPFDRSRRLASGYASIDGEWEIGVKGAPEEVLARASVGGGKHAIQGLDEPARQMLLAVMAGEGQGGRMLGVGSRMMARPPADRDEAERDLVFEGVLIFRDPVREDVPGAMVALRGAGVGVSIVTGDQATTAAAVAKQAGIANAHALTGADLAGLADRDLVETTRRGGAVVARAQPADKLRIVQALGAAGEVVMVTGDGVNDAPALRAAAVGVAMGRVGSDVARQAADVVLTNDSFATLVEAVREGRRLYDNLHKAVAFYLAVKVALVLASALAALSGQPLPFTPVQIVVLELFMDLGAALAFVAQPADRDVLTRPPRDPRSRLLDRSALVGIFAGGLTLAALVDGTYFYAAASYSLSEARTFALVAWFVGHVALGIATAERRTALRDLIGNPALLIWASVTILFAAGLAFFPPLQAALSTSAIPWREAVLCAGLAALVPLWVALVPATGQRTSRRSA